MLEELDQVTEKVPVYRSPLLWGFLAIIVVGFAVGYFLMDQQKPLSSDDAYPVVKSVLAARGPALAHFHVGLVKPSVDEKPYDPHYQLLAKGGVLRVQKLKEGAIQVAFMPGIEKELERLPNYKTWRNPDGTTAYALPLAERELIGVTSVTMTGANAATVEYTWRWVPNRFGELFDTGSKQVQSFSRWERLTLIDKYGVDFYRATEPKKDKVTLVRSDKGWKPGTLE